jgi:hypothetical protein
VLLLTLSAISAKNILSHDIFPRLSRTARVIKSFIDFGWTNWFHFNMQLVVATEQQLKFACCNTCMYAASAMHGA